MVGRRQASALLHAVQGTYFNTHNADLGDFLKYHKLKLEPTHLRISSLLPGSSSDTLGHPDSALCEGSRCGRGPEKGPCN